MQVGLETPRDPQPMRIEGIEVCRSAPGAIDSPMRGCPESRKCMGLCRQQFMLRVKLVSGRYHAGVIFGREQTAWMILRISNVSKVIS